MNFDLRSMQLYLAVLELGNFSEAARREGISPSSVSRSVQQLESALGVQLFYRSTRAAMPTEAGRLWGESFRRMLDQLTETSHALREQAGQPAGLVRINAPVAFGQAHIAPWLGELAQRYPALQVELVQTDQFVDPHTDAADLLFRIGPLADSGFHARVVDRPQYHFAASPDYLKRYGSPQTPDDLLQHNCLVYKGMIGAQRAFVTRPGRATQVLSLHGTLLSNNAQTLVNAALAGAGVVTMPDWLIGTLLQQGRLIRLLSDCRVAVSQEPQVIAMLYPRTRALPLNIRALIDFFAEKFGEPAYWKFDADA